VQCVFKNLCGFRIYYYVYFFLFSFQSTQFFIRFSRAISIIIYCIIISLIIRSKLLQCKAAATFSRWIAWTSVLFESVVLKNRFGHIVIVYYTYSLWSARFECESYTLSPARSIYIVVRSIGTTFFRPPTVPSDESAPIMYIRIVIIIICIKLQCEILVHHRST